jgi:uncharacterized repeat protein (TIGR03803 family)
MLVSFSSPNGLSTYAGLLQAADGMLYGVSAGGGSNNVGALFKMYGNGSGFTILYNFGTTTNDGHNPQAALMQGADGALYGTTIYGGIYNGGTVFKINPDGTGFTTLHNFTFSGPPVVVGEQPTCQLLQANDGLLYGTTSQGGTYQAGTVFRLSTNGTGYAVLYTFHGAGGDGRNPNAGLIQGNDGALYGTTYGGGTGGYGTVFKLNPDGSGYAILHSFSTNASDGQLLNGRLVQANNGILYGTTQQGGSYGQGTIFGVNTTGTAYRVVYHFGTTPGDGQTIVAGLIQGSDGALYGQASAGGDLNAGTVFRLVLPPLMVMPPVFTSITRLDGGNVGMTLSVTANATYSLQSSSDLVNWAVQTNIFAASSTIQVSDLTATHAATRFYRAVWRP